MRATEPAPRRASGRRRRARARGQRHQAALAEHGTSGRPTSRCDWSARRRSSPTTTAGRSRPRGDLHPCPLHRRRDVGDHPQPDRRAHPRAPPRPADQLAGPAALSTELVDARDSPSVRDDVGRDAHFRCAKETRRAGTEVQWNMSLLTPVSRVGRRDRKGG